MKIALLGYGKMGKEIETIALQRGHNVVLKVDHHNAAATNTEQLSQADLAIEFSTPHTVLENIRKAFAANIPIVVGTTGWYQHLNEVSELCQQHNQALFYASNFSIGVNIFFEINKKLAQLIKPYPYQLSIEEIHHTQKLDSPSGTAISIAEGIMEMQEQKKKWVNSTSAAPASATNDSDILISSVREENVPGTHSVLYNSAVDSIEIKHTAHNRQGFASGAVLAAEWLQGRTGVFTMADMMNFSAQ